jgi:hypothetical protein
VLIPATIQWLTGAERDFFTGLKSKNFKPADDLNLQCLNNCGFVAVFSYRKATVPVVHNVQPLTPIKHAEDRLRRIIGGYLTLFASFGGIP